MNPLVGSIVGLCKWQQCLVCRPLVGLWARPGFHYLVQCRPAVESESIPNNRWKKYKPKIIAIFTQIFWPKIAPPPISPRFILPSIPLQSFKSLSLSNFVLILKNFSPNFEDVYVDLQASTRIWLVLELIVRINLKNWVTVIPSFCISHSFLYGFFLYNPNSFPTIL